MNILHPLRYAEYLPFYFISFHGAYKEVNTSHTVPQGSYLLETCDPGEISFNTIDNYIWHLCNYAHREQFLHWLSKHNSEPSQNKYEAAVRALKVHLPGSAYAQRHHMQQVGAGGRGFFQGIYKFSNTTPYTVKHPRTNGDTLYKDFVENLIQTREPTTNTEIMELIHKNDPDAADGAVFIFVSCGVYNLDMNPNDIYRLNSFFHEKKLAMMALHDGVSRDDIDNGAVSSDEDFIEEDARYERRMGRFKRLKKEVKELRRF